MESIGHIYVLKHPTTGEIRYVGQTQQKPQTRLYQHTYRNPEKPLGKWIGELKSYGLSPVIEVIETLPFYRLDEREEYYIDNFREMGIDLLNVLSVGQGRKGYKPPQEVRERISAGVKEYWNNLDEQTKEELINAFKAVRPDWNGKTHSEEARAKQSESALIRYEREQARIAELENLLTENPDQPELQEELDQLKNLHKGMYSEEQARQHSETMRIKYEGNIPPHLTTPEARQKAAESRRGQPMSDEKKERLRQANLGKTLSPEVREKIGKSQRGKKDSPEVRERKSVAQQKRIQEHGINQDLFTEEKNQSRSVKMTDHWRTGVKTYSISPEVQERANRKKSEDNKGKVFGDPANKKEPATIDSVVRMEKKNMAEWESFAKEDLPAIYSTPPKKMFFAESQSKRFYSHQQFADWIDNEYTGEIKILA